MEKWKNYRGIGLLAVTSLFVLGVVGFIFLQSREPTKELTAAQLLAQTSSTTTSSHKEGQVQSSKTIVVDIKGQVHKPGVYEIAADSRLNELVKIAGGLTAEANDRELNQAIVLQDQQMIYVPHKEETVSPNASAAVTAGAQSGNAPSAAGELNNINTADLGELQQLSGIGEKKAQAIIQYREENGGFKNIDELTEVSGIGEKTLEKLKSSVTI